MFKQLIKAFVPQRCEFFNPYVGETQFRLIAPPQLAGLICRIIEWINGTSIDFDHSNFHQIGG